MRNSGAALNNTERTNISLALSVRPVSRRGVLALSEPLERRCDAVEEEDEVE